MSRFKTVDSDTTETIRDNTEIPVVTLEEGEAALLFTAIPSYPDQKNPSLRIIIHCAADAAITHHVINACNKLASESNIRMKIIAKNVDDEIVNRIKKVLFDNKDTFHKLSLIGSQATDFNEFIKAIKIENFETFQVDEKGQVKAAVAAQLSNDNNPGLLARFFNKR